MTIKDINIISFGKIKNKRISFSDNLNVIYGRNESGKTTVSAFIEAMFYSFPPRSDRTKYLPWDNSTAGGEMTVAHEGKTTTFYRCFAPTPKGDVLEPKGFSLEGMIPADRESYRKSIYSRESLAGDFGITADIDKKISNLLATGDESTGVAGAIKNLEKLRRSLNGGNKQKNLENKISLLEDEYAFALREEKRSRALKEEIAQKKALLKKLEKEAEDAERNAALRKKTALEKLDCEIKAQSEYISSFPKTDLPRPEKKPFFDTSLIFYIICSFIIFIACFFIKPILSVTAILPPALYMVLYFIGHNKYKKAASAFLQSVGCTSFPEYERMMREYSEAEDYYTALLKKKSDMVTLSASRVSYGDENIYKKILAIKNDIERLNSCISTKSRELNIIKEEIDYHRSLLSSLKEKLEAVRIALEAFSYAKDIISTDFTPKVTKKAMEYLNFIAPKEGREVTLSTDMTFSVMDPVRQNILSQSFGFREEMYICFRIAWAEFLYGKDFSLIFDDPFLGSDDYREKALIDLFYNLSKTRQVIIFTNRKNSYFNQLNCNWVDISPSDVV